MSFDTLQAGPLEVTRDGDLLAMDFPSWPPEAKAADPRMLAALGATPARELCRARPHSGSLRPRRRGGGAAARFRRDAPDPGRQCDRDGTRPRRRRLRLAVFRAQPRGRRGPGHRLRPLRADPLLGGAARQDAARLRGRFRARGGELVCTLRGDRVTLAGRAVLYLEGTITV